MYPQRLYSGRKPSTLNESSPVSIDAKGLLLISFVCPAVNMVGNCATLNPSINISWQRRQPLNLFFQS